MPLPLILLAGAGIAGARGLQKMAQGVGHLGDAKSIGERGTRLAEITRTQLEQRDQALQTRVQGFAEHRQTVQLTSLVRFAQLYERQIARMKLTDKEFAARFHLPVAELQELQKTTAFTLDLARVALEAGRAGIGIGKGAAFLVGSYGMASTGTAIGTLSGAAATNATLAWLGGGSLAAGGGGMAMGTLVLGGLAAAPALIVAGYGVARKGEQALSSAVEFEAQVLRYRAQAKVRWALQEGIERRMDELAGVLEGTRIRLDQAVAVCEREERLFGGFVNDDSFNPALLLAQSVSALLKVEVHDKEGRVPVELDAAAPAARKEMKPATLTEPPLENSSDWTDPVEVVSLHDSSTSSATFDADAVLANINGRLLHWSLNDADLEPHDYGFAVGTITHLQAHPDEDFVVGSRGRKSTMMFTDLHQDRPEMEELELDGTNVIRTAFTNNGSQLLLACEKKTMLLDCNSGDVLWERQPPAEPTRAMAVHPQQRYLAFASNEKAIQLLNLPSGKQVWSASHDFWCNDLAFSPDGQWLLSASEDKTARLWSVGTGQECHRFEFGGRFADRVAFAPDGTQLAVGFANGTVGLWDTQSGQLVNLFHSGKGRITALQFSAEGDGLLVAGEGGLRLCFPAAGALDPS